MTDCLFCKIASGEIPTDKTYEDADFIAFLDIKPINPGHLLLVPKEHHENLFEMPDDLLSKTAPLLKKLAIAVKNAVNAEGINIGMNNGAPAGQVVFHAHIHIMPRKSGDGYEMWHGQPYQSDSAKSEIASKIKTALNFKL